MASKSSIAARQDGLDSEKRVIEYLSTLGEVRPSLLYENKSMDIDVHWKPYGDPWFIPVSIKSNEPQYSNAPFLFERVQYWMQEEYDEQVNDDVVYTIHPRWERMLVNFPRGVVKEYWVEPRPSWWYTGQATEYIVWKRDTPTTGKVYLLHKELLKVYVKLHGWTATSRNSGDAQTREVAEGRAATDIGLLDIQTVLENGLGYVLGEIK